MAVKTIFGTFMKKFEKKEMPPRFSENSDWRYSLSYIEGVATIADIHGILFTRFLDDMFRDVSDDEALSADWKRVGQDIDEVIFQIQNRFQNELKKVSETASIDEAVSKAIEKNAFEMLLDAAARENGNEQIKASAWQKW